MTLGLIELRTDRKKLPVLNFAFTIRVVGLSPDRSFSIGGGSFIAQTGGGLYFVAPAILATIVASITARG